MQNVLVIGGCRQSGKSSAAKFITGYRLKEAGIINWFDMSEVGDLLVQAYHQDGKGDVVETRDAILDIYRQDYEFALYAHENIWSNCKVFSFATELKESAINIFGLNRKNVYGSDTDKEECTHIKWKDIWSLIPKDRQKEIKTKYGGESPELMTHREVLQEFGTICRVFDPNCWVNACWNKIKEQDYPYCIIDDCRYLNEINISKKNGAKVLLLENQPIKDTHNSEKILSFDRTLFDFIIDNTKMSLKQKNDELIKILYSIGWSQAKL